MKYIGNYINKYREIKKNNYNPNIFLIKIIILFIYILTILSSINNFFINKSLFYNSKTNKIINVKLNNEANINKYYLEISKIKGINYLNRCLNYLNKTIITSNFNIFNFKFKAKKKPKISVIIPVYNCQKTIELSLTSILNQKMRDFEIILINDNSNDNSLKIINKMEKKDNRIKIINNHKNMGTLYSRCIGALNSKGKYIFCLDNDDLFLDEKVFLTIYNLAQNGKYDIVEFKSLKIPNYHPKIEDIKECYFNFHPNNLILHQPELGIFPISRNNNYRINDNLVWAKCIKTKLYQISVNALGKKRYSIYNCWTEDISIIFIIFNFANSFIFVNIYGILHLSSKITATFTLPSDHKIFTEFYLLNIILDFEKINGRYKKYVVLKAYHLFNKLKKWKLSKVNKKYLKGILQRIFDSKYINQNDKILIKKKYSKYIIW